MKHLLGISAFYHDAAAALLRDGQVLAAAQEERFTRRKNDERFPKNAIDFCLEYAGVMPEALDGVVFYDKPITKFTRMLESYLAVAPGGWRTFPGILPAWLGEKLNLRKTLRDTLPGLGRRCPIYFTQHHEAHAASAFYPSPFKEAAILTVDGVGEWATTTLGRGKGNRIELLQEIRFPHSLGLLYSAFTAYCGFRVNSGEYKLMGLAPYGEPRFTHAILSNLIDLKDDGSFRLNLDYFDFLRGATMTHERFHRLFGGPARVPGSEITQRYMDVARSIQEVTQEAMVRLALQAKEVTGLSHLCLAGGVALNCVANGLILRKGIFDRLWIQPAAGDAGGSLGAALAVWHGHLADPAPGATTRPGAEEDAMAHSLLGPSFSDREIEGTLAKHGAVYTKLHESALIEDTARLLERGNVIGWFQGRMEFGPRALGNRSILGDPRSAKMQSIMNRHIKFRESFRPFAPVVLEDRLRDYFDLDVPSPYMLLVAFVREGLRVPTSPCDRQGLDRVKEVRSSIPAVTHIDHSARIQTLTREANPRLHALLKRFESATGCGVLINTSFNVRDEPIVCTPGDAYRCFVKTRMDYLVMGNFLLDRRRQPREIVPPRLAAVADSPMQLRLKEDPKEWIKFTAAMGAVFSLIVWGFQRRGWLGGTGWLRPAPLVLFVAAAALRPQWFRRFYRVGMTGFFYLGQFMGRMVLFLFFFLVITPLGLLMRVMGKDLLDLKPDPKRRTHWRKTRPGGDHRRQF